MTSEAHPPHITHYRVVSELDLDRLHLEVETAIHNGWQPFGSLAVNRTDEGVYFAQPIVRYADFSV